MDRIAPTPRNRVLGLLADTLAELEEKAKSVRQPNPLMMVPSLLGGQTPQTAILNLLGVPALQKTVERMSYGEPLTTGRGMTTRPRQETTEAALLAAGIAGPAAKAGEKAAMAVGKAGERLAERAVPAVMERGGLPAEMMQAMGQGSVSPLIVYHGSPAKFQRFDPTKIGSGEGAQSYGYGHYVAEAPDVATSYKNLVQRDPNRLMVDGKVVSPDTMYGRAAEDVARIGLKATLQKIDDNIQFNEKYAPDMAAMYRDLRKKIEALEPTKVTLKEGNLYTIDLPDEKIAKMLDWDKPLNQQSEFVKNALLSDIDQAINITKKSLETASERRRPSTLKDLSGFERERNRLLGSTGQKLYQELSLGESRFAPSASSKLRDIGIPGIRYLDQGSRSNFSVQNLYKGQPYGEPVSFMTELQAKEYAAEQVKKGFDTKMVPGTSNFVVFPGEEELLRILERNGVPITSLLD